MEWTVTIEGRDELGELQQAQLRIENGFKRLTSGDCRSRFSARFVPIRPRRNSWSLPPAWEACCPIARRRSSWPSFCLSRRAKAMCQRGSER